MTVFKEMINWINPFIAASVAIWVRNGFDSSDYGSFFLPLISALISFFTVGAIINFFNKGEIKEFEGTWVEIINSCFDENLKCISIFKLDYDKKNKKYFLKGFSYTSKGTLLSTWLSEKIYIHKNTDLEVNYIYESKILDKELMKETTVTGYSNINFSQKRGYIVDISNNNDTNTKKDFELKKFSTVDELEYILVEEQINERITKLIIKEKVKYLS